MKQRKRWGFLHYGIVVTLVMSVILGYHLFFGSHKYYLPGKSTHGHHQIELQCNACHVESFSDGEPMQAACVACHGDELAASRDTHPKKKFTDPRNAALMENLDATACVTCHVEHSLEITDDYGVTLPKDFCFYCHEGIAEERPSHTGMAFDTCSNSGCHSYHDNRALYEKFLRKHIDKPSVLAKKKILKVNGLALWEKQYGPLQNLQASDQNGARLLHEVSGAENKIVSQWRESMHAMTGVNCLACHKDSKQKNSSKENVLPVQATLEGVKPRVERLEIENVGVGHATDLSIDSCEECHQIQNERFEQGLHGMRLSADLSPMTVAQARLPMHADAASEELTCSSCHDPHKPDLKAAAVDACLGCHNDEHSRNYQASAHARLYEQELSGELAAGEGVSCATCHMPKVKKGKRVYVEHNQSATLKPNNKMLRPVCQNCHGLEYAIAALADRTLIESNFNGSFNSEHASFDMVRKRIEQRRQKRAQRSN